MKITIDVQGDPFFTSVLQALSQRRGSLTQHDAAALVHLSASRFAHKFKLLNGQSFRLARATVKLQIAQHLLTTTTLPISSIAAESGYGDRAAFDKAFKANYGVTAVIYRRQHLGT
jgi:transcriptional regulator GlxA family with amidase domain